jgi:hypothetical protein
MSTTGDRINNPVPSVPARDPEGSVAGSVEGGGVESPVDPMDRFAFSAPELAEAQTSRTHPVIF